MVLQENPIHPLHTVPTPGSVERARRKTHRITDEEHPIRAHDQMSEVPGQPILELDLLPICQTILEASLLI